MESDRWAGAPLEPPDLEDIVDDAERGSCRASLTGRFSPRP
jgi:hypothetical protein